MSVHRVQGALKAELHDTDRPKTKGSVCVCEEG